LRILFGLLSCVASLFFISGVFYPIEFHSFYSNTVHNAVFFFSVVCIFFICIFFDKRLEIRFEIPKTFIAIFINFILICFLAHYDGHIYRSRFVKVMDFVFILTAVYKTIQTIENIYINKLKKEYHDKRITTT